MLRGQVPNENSQSMMDTMAFVCTENAKSVAELMMLIPGPLSMRLMRLKFDI